MKVTLNIANDEELRIHVKELIAGQIKSMAREEVRMLVKEILTKKIQDSNLPNAEFIFKQEVSMMVKDQLKSQKGGWNSPTFIQEEAKKIIRELIKEAMKNGQLI